MCVGLPGRHGEKPDTLDLFPSSVWEPKIECLDLYTYVYICISVSGLSWNFQPDKLPQNRTVRFKTGHLATVDVCYLGSQRARHASLDDGSSELCGTWQNERESVHRGTSVWQSTSPHYLQTPYTYTKHSVWWPALQRAHGSAGPV